MAKNKKKHQIGNLISERSGNNNKIYSAAIDEDYYPHTFLHTDVNYPMIAQNCLNVNLDMPLSTIWKKYMKLLHKFHPNKWNIDMLLWKYNQSGILWREFVVTGIFEFVPQQGL